jgi:hypothetical protein
MKIIVTIPPKKDGYCVSGKTLPQAGTIVIILYLIKFAVLLRNDL